MQLFRSPVPVALSVLVLLSNFLCFTDAFPLSNSLNPRDVQCAPAQVSCGTYCCPSKTTCAPGGPNGGCAPAPTLPPLPPLPTLPGLPTASPTASPTPTPSAVTQGKASPFSTTTLIIIVSVGGGVALIFILIGTWACHRKRQQGRALLAAYESPDREPYEAISLKTKKSTASFISTAPPRTPTDSTFNIPQHAASPPPVYLGDEKQPFPRYPPSTLQVSEATTPSRAVFPVEVLASPRTSSLPPYSPQRSAFTPYSPQRGTPLEVKTAFSPAQPSVPFTSQPEPAKMAYSQPPPAKIAYSQPTPVQQQQQTFSPVQPAFLFTPQPEAPFSPVQSTFSPVQPVFSPVQSTFTLAPQAHIPVRPLFSPVQSEFSFATHGTTPVCSPPVSPHTARMTREDMFLPVDMHAPAPPPPQEQYPMAY